MDAFALSVPCGYLFLDCDFCDYCHISSLILNIKYASPGAGVEPASNPAPGFHGLSIFDESPCAKHTGLNLFILE